MGNGYAFYFNAVGIDITNALCIDCSMISSEKLKEARGLMKESQAAFAVRLGVDQATVHRWETKGLPKRGPGKKTIEIVLASLLPQAAE